MLNLHMANQCRPTKFKVSSFNHSGDILGGGLTEKLNGSRGNSHALFRDGLLSVAKTIYDRAVYQSPTTKI